MVSPLSIVMLFGMDAIFMINTSILEPIFVLIAYATIGVFNFTSLSELINKTYEILLGMRPFDVEGFRRMRMIH